MDQKIRINTFLKVSASVKYFLIIVLLLLSANIVAQKQDKLINDGLKAAYNFNWEKSYKTFNTLLKKYPESPAGYHFKSVIPLWFYLGSLQKENLDSFYFYSDKGLKLLEAKMDSDSVEAFDLLIAGNIYLNRAIANGRSENFLEAFMSAQKSKNYLDKAIALDSTLYDAYLGIGMYNFALSQVPEGFQWAIDIIGINSNPDAGEEILKICEKKGKYLKVDASFYLSQIYERVLLNYGEADKRLSNLIKSYPGNLLFNLTHASVQLKRYNFKDAEKKLKFILSKDDSNFVYITDQANYLLGNSFYFQNQYDSAKKYYQNFLQSDLREDYKGIVNYRMGLIFSIYSKRDSALAYFKSASDFDTDIEEDIYAKKRSEIYIEMPLTKVERFLHQTENLLKSGKFKLVSDTLKSSFNKITTKRDSLNALLQLAEAFYKLKDYSSAKEFSITVIENFDDEESWLIPYAYLIAAESSFESGEIEESKYFLDEAEKRNDHDFRIKLRNKMRLLKNKINESELNN